MPVKHPDVELEVRIRNNQLKQRRDSLGLSQSELAELIGMNQSNYSQYENLSGPPITQKGKWKDSAKKIADFFDEPLEVLFPLWLYDINKSVVTRKLSREEVQASLMVDMPRALLPDETYAAKQTSKDVVNLLGILSDRETRVIKLLYGLGCEEHTKVQVAGLIGVSHERIRQLHAKSIVKIRRILAKRLEDRARLIEGIL